MAGALNRVQDEIEMAEGDAVAAKLEVLTLEEILEPGLNLADMLADTVLSKIGQHVIRDVEIDDRSRGKGSGEKGEAGGWLHRYRKWLDIAMQSRETKNFPWPKASNVKYPLLTVASVQFQARAYPAIVEGSNLVRGRVLGPDPDGSKRARADRIGQHMTWQLLYRMAGWEEETDRLLLMLPITGCVFRKTYFDSVANANCSEMVSGEDFIINYWAKSLDSAPRYTHLLRFYPHEVKEKFSAELWRPVRVEPEQEDSEDEDALVEFYEQHRTLDLDGDGYPEPYVVTATKDGEVARIVPCFGPEEVTVMAADVSSGRPMELPAPMKLADALQAGHAVIKIVRIERRQYFTKYGFIPAPDGSFYDIGFGALLEDLTASIDTSINQMLDAGALQNAGGGFLGTGINMKGGIMTRRLGEWKRVDVTAGTLRDNVLPFDSQGPSVVLFSLLGMLIESAKEITAVQDVMTGQGTANQPATTTLALIEQGHKVMTAIFKRIHRSFGQELRILRRLNRDYLDEEEYFQLNDSAPEVDPQTGQPVQQEPVKVGREDYADDDLDVIPVSDPNTVSDMQKMARAQALMMFNNDPLVNQLEIRKRVIDAIGERDTKALFDVPPPAPDPKILIEGMKEARAKLMDAAKVRASDAAAAMKLVEAAEKAILIGSYVDAAAFLASANELGGDLENGDPGEGGVSEMAGIPPDGGILPAAEGPPAGFDGGMGPGGSALPGAAGGGGPLGPVGSDAV